MSYTPEIKNKISTLNSTTLTNVTSGQTWTGAAEDVSKYGRLGVSIWSPFGESIPTPVTGTLTMEVSRDNVNWGGPNREFANTAISEPHMWNIVEKYFRLTYTHGAQTASTIDIQTQLSVNSDVLLGHQLNAPLIDETEGIITRSVGVGQNPLGGYLNNKTDGVAFQTTDNLASGATYSTDVLDAQGYTQVQTHIVSDNDGTLGFKFCSTSNCSGTTVGENGVERYLSVPYSSSGGFQLFSAPAFTPYIQYTFLNGGTGATTQLFYETKFLTKSLSGQLLAMDSFISPSMIANLGRSVIVGKESDGNFQNVSVTETINDDGVYHNLNVVSGARPSQLAGRTNVTVSVDTAIDELLYTVTSGKTLYITDIVLTIANSNTGAQGRADIRDSLSAATGTFKVPLITAEAPNSSSTTSVYSHTFAEPMKFIVGIYCDIITGTNVVGGFLEGYEE